jgi:signal transduction histidine kinase/ActR/RegA family two-component response regulator
MTRVPLSRRLFIVVVAAVVPLAIMAAYSLFAGYDAQRRQAENAGLDVARAFHAAVAAELRRTISVLQVFGNMRAADPLDPDITLERARQTLKQEPNWRGISVADAEGHLILDSRQGADGGIPALVDPESMEAALRTQAPVVGNLRKGPAGRYAFAVRVPVVRDGRARQVLTAIVDPNAILSVVSTPLAAGEWIVAVADRNGNRVARTKSVEQSLGTPFSASLIEMINKQGPEGKGPSRTSEGDSVFTAYTRTGEFGWTTAVGLSTRAVDAAARESFTTYGVGVTLSTLLGILAALFMARHIVRPVTELREAAVGLGRGESFKPPSTDVQEIHDVAMALATTVEAQDRSRLEREDLLRREQAARAAAEASNRSKDEFLAMLGHELRNPLGAISNAATVLGNEHLDEDAAERTRTIIVRQVGHLSRLTDDLLDAGRALMGKIVLRTRTVDLSAVAMQSLATLKSAHRLGRHRMVEDFETVWVEADPVRLDQVLGNLVVNAVKYTPDGGTIRLSVRREGGEAVLCVSDNGIGIEPELLAHVFDLFRQGSRDLERSLGGLGIGLTLVRRLAELHGGSASVHSEGTGKGSEFTVRLPVAPEPGREGEKTRAAAEARPGRHILVVEDNPDARETLAMLLELAGHRVELAADGATGLEKALALQPEVALVDVGLPRMDGYEVARRIRASKGVRRPYLVALTGYGAPEDRERALGAGFDAHIVKPVDPDTLAEVLAQSETRIEF